MMQRLLEHTHSMRLLRLGLAGLAAALLMALFSPERPAAAQSDATTVIQMVNALRAEYDLPPYQINPALMAAAQTHSEWAASVGTHSHTGPGGSTPRDRAIAAGYGGGETVRVSENIYWGGRATPSSAVGWWTNSAIHFQGMTSTNYIHIGAGVASSEDGTFFTLKFGSIIEDTTPPQTQNQGGAGTNSGTNGDAQSDAGGPTFTIDPIEVTEANEDGSVIHVIGEGQTVWAIAEAYDTPVSEVLALNYLSEDSIVQPGDELVIVPAPVEVEENSGPIYHTVEPGQTTGGIAAAYGVPLEELLAKNDLTEFSIIYPDDVLLVRGEEPTPTPTPTVDLLPAATPTPTSTPRAAAQGSTEGPEPGQADRPAAQPTEAAPAESSAFGPVEAQPGTQPSEAASAAEADPQPQTPMPPRNAVIAGLAVLGVLGAGLIVVGGFIIKPG